MGTRPLPVQFATANFRLAGTLEGVYGEILRLFTPGWVRPGAGQWMDLLPCCICAAAAAPTSVGTANPVGECSSIDIE